jgi:SAM-dependent methyltransferase
MWNESKTGKVKYFHLEEFHNLRAPSVIVPDLLALLRPRSVVDIGCGLGTFLAPFRESGVIDLMGIDGNWVNRHQLYIDEKYFIEADLEKPFDFRRRFDLAICVEVAEHLDPRSADTIVATLCSASDIIVFSAALPGQGGENHLNEQPFDYWQEKFAKRGYQYFDIFRHRYWNDDRIDWWYRQNMFLVANRSVQFGDEIEKTRIKGTVESAIHPELFANVLADRDRLLSLREELSTASGVLKLAGRKLQRAVTGTNRRK